MPQSPSSSSSSEAERDALIDLIEEQLYGVYHCTRVWEAWSVGTMSQDDFSEARGSTFAPDLADAILEKFARATPPSLPIDFKQASELLSMFGGEAGEVTLRVTDGHSGKGLYAHYTEYPEEGAEFLGATDGWAVPTSPSPHPEEGALLLGGDEGGKKGGAGMSAQHTPGPCDCAARLAGRIDGDAHLEGCTNYARTRWALIDPAHIANTCSPRHVQSVLEDAQRTIADQLAALLSAEKVLAAVSSEMTLGERFTNTGQDLIDSLPVVRAAIAEASGSAA